MNDEINSFIDQYRDALGRQRSTSIQALDNARRNYYQNLMGSSNTMGMMYSNFPERAKYQYEANTYMPSLSKIENTYQTGLDAIRNNVVNSINTIADLKDAIAAQNKANDPRSNFYINDSGDYAFWDNNTGTTQYRNNQSQNIRFGTAAQRAGYSTPGDIIGYASQTLKGQDEINRLNSLWEKAKEQGMTGITYNVGDNFTPNTFNFLTDAERDFLDSLGLSFQ